MVTLDFVPSQAAYSRTSYHQHFLRTGGTVMKLLHFKYVPLHCYYNIWMQLFQWDWIIRLAGKNI